MTYHFNRKLQIILFLILLYLPGMLLADIAILIHGYHTEGKTWRNSGITQVLASKGWYDISFSGITAENNGKYIVAVELPAKAPIEIQANYLTQYLAEISQKNPQHKIHLIAHSAGGVVARLALVNSYANFVNGNSNDFIPIVQLITIASPHLGSPIAEMLYSAAADTPIGFFAPFIGLDEINDAEVLYKQLSREHKNNFLYWLNRQPHPPIKYISIVRADGSLLSGDIYVPPHSQNMAFIPAINQHSQVVLTPGDHGLKFNDGIIISHLLP